MNAELLETCRHDQIPQSRPVNAHESLKVTGASKTRGRIEGDQGVQDVKTSLFFSFNGRERTLAVTKNEHMKQI